MSDVNRVERETEEENRFRSDKVERESPPKDKDSEEASLDEAPDDTVPASDKVPPRTVE